MLFCKKNHNPFFVSLVLILSLLGCNQAGSYEPVPQNPRTQKTSDGETKFKAPEFELVDLEGNKFGLKDFKGKVVFLDFWATWCGPCRISTPEVEKLAERYEDKGVEVVSISLDSSERSVRRYVKKLDFKSRVAMVGDSQVDLQYRVQSIPTFYLIDQNGDLVNLWAGYNFAMAKQWRKEIDQLLKT